MKRCFAVSRSDKVVAYALGLPSVLWVSGDSYMSPANVVSVGRHEMEPGSPLRVQGFLQGTFFGLTR